MRAVGKTILEMLLLGCVALAVAFGANRARGKGSLDVTRDYFSLRPIKRTATTPVKAPAGDANSAGREPSPSVDAPAVQQEPANTNAVAPAEGSHVDHGYQDISFAAVKEIFNDPATASGANVFIDARNDDSYEEGHIPGALQCDHYELDNYLPAVLPLAEGAERVIVYCNGGDCEDSIFMCQDLLEAGISYDNLYLFSGGWHAWKTGDMPIATGRKE